MKQTLFILAFIIFVINGYSQEYHPIVNETNNWSVVSGGIGAILKVACVQTNHYRFEGDTIIQLADYKKILSSTDSINQTWETIGFIREDTIQKKVWIRDLENQEGLVYDFDLSLEEEITLYNPFFWEAITYKVSEIDSILIQTKYRKTFVLKTDDGWEEKWIEGIGSEFGIVNSNIFGLVGGFRELLCFSGNNIQYVNPKFETCHKNGFSPAITNQNIDTAVINQNYSFQITTTEIFDYDSISYFLIGSQLPKGLSLNNESGLISGIPTELGSFHLFICVSNNGYVTDYLDADLVVDSAFGQVNFPDSNAIWNVNIRSTGEILYGLKGDTLINDTLYNKLYTLSDTILSVENLQDYIGGFRQEGQKVWFRPAYWSYQDILLYDFSASIGDTIWNNGGAHYNYSQQIVFGYGHEYSIIQGIDTENGIKTYFITRGTDQSPGKWYEGIGSNFGLFGSIVQFPLAGDTYNLACFKHNDTVKYQNNLKCNKCFCGGGGSGGIDEKKYNTEWISIFTNPSKNLLAIEVQKPYSKIMVEIFDEQGSVVYKKETLNSPITLDAFMRGIYFIKLSVDDETITKKIIIE